MQNEYGRYLMFKKKIRMKYIFCKNVKIMCTYFKNMIEIMELIPHIYKFIYTAHIK